MKMVNFIGTLLLLFVLTAYTEASFNVKSVAKGLEREFLKLGRKSNGVIPIRRKITDVITRKNWVKTKPSYIPGKVDLVFVLDQSGSIGNHHLRLAKRFMKELTRHFSIARSNTRVALITYSSSVQTKFDFKKYGSRECISKEMDKNLHSYGVTATGAALQQAIQLYKSSSSGSRKNVQRVVFVLTDGMSNRGIRPSVPSAFLKNSLKAKVFTLGIGLNIRQSELQSIATNTAYVFQVRSFQDLQKVTRSFSTKSTFDTCSGRGLAYDECGRKCRCVNGKLTKCCRVRKDFTSMTITERRRFVNAWKTVSTSAAYKERYGALIAVHRQEFNSDIHLVNQFLPWHRYFILELENLLQEVDCRVTLPYWDWSLWSHHPWTAADIWSSSASGLGGNGQRGSQCVRNGAFASPAWSTTTGACLRRNFNGVPPDAAQVQYCLGLDNFLEFELFLRINLHNVFHCNVEGTMCSIDSANAPEFFLHHGFIDKIWGDWQRKSSLNLNAHFPGVSQQRMRSSPYVARDLMDNNNLPGCVKVYYEDPTHGQSRRVLNFVRSLSTTQLKALHRENFSQVSQRSNVIFGVTDTDRLRARRLERESRRNVRPGIERKLKTTLERKTGFKLAKPRTFINFPMRPFRNFDFVMHRKFPRL